MFRSSHGGKGGYNKLSATMIPVTYDFMKTAGISRNSSYISGVRNKCPYCNFNVPVQKGVDSDSLIQKHIRKSENCQRKRDEYSARTLLQEYGSLQKGNSNAIKYGMVREELIMHDYAADYYDDYGDQNFDGDIEEQIYSRRNIISDDPDVLKKLAEEMLERDEWDRNKEEKDTRYDFATEPPSNAYVEHQYTTMLTVINSVEGPIRRGWIRDNRGVPVKSDWMAIINIYNFVREYGLSISAGDKLLYIYRTICERHGVHIAIPDTYTSINSAINRSIQRKEDVIEFDIPVLELFMGTEIEEDLRDFILPASAIGVYVDVMKLIAEELIYLNDDDFDWEPIHYEDENGVICHGFSGSQMFKDMVSAVHSVYGQHTRVIAISMSCDDTVADKVGKKKLCPVYVKLLNRKEESGSSTQNIYLVGFAPVFTRTDKEILAWLETKFVHKYKCDQILSWCKKVVRLKFLERVFKTTVEGSRNGVNLQCGSEWKSDPTRSPYVVLFGPNMNDNEGADKYCGHVRSNGGNCNCRICVCRSAKFWDLDELAAPFEESSFSKYRDAATCEALGRRHQEIWIKWMRSGPRSLTRDEDEVIKQAKKLNVGNIDNPLHSWYRFHTKMKITNIYFCNPIDLLHTILKGLIENALRWSVAVIALFSRLASVKSEHWFGVSPMATMDSRMSTFDIYQSSYPMYTDSTRHVAINGISILFSDTTKVTDALAKGVMTGGAIDAQRLGDLLFQFVLNFGTAGRILPNKNWKFFSDKPYTANPTAVVLRACWSALHVMFLLKGNWYQTFSLNYLQQSIRSAIVHMLKLYELKQNLAGVEESFLYVVKLHSIIHFPALINLFGHPGVFDTVIPEHAHIETNRLYRISSRRHSTALAELLQGSRNKRRAKHLVSEYDLQKDEPAVKKLQGGEETRRLKNGIIIKPGAQVSENSLLLTQDGPNCGSYLPQFGSVYMKWISKEKTIVAHTHGDIKGGHMRGPVRITNDISVPKYPFIKGDHILMALKRRSLTEPRCELIYDQITTDNGAFICELLPAIRIFGKFPGISGDSFMLYATREYQVKRGVSSAAMKYINRFDCIEAKVHRDESVCPVKVMAIVSFRLRIQNVATSSHKRRIMLLVCRLKEVAKSVTEQLYPLPLVELDYYKQIWLELIDINCIVSPISCFFDPDNKPLNHLEGITVEASKSYRYWLISPKMYYKCRKDYPLDKESVCSFFGEKVIADDIGSPFVLDDDNSSEETDSMDEGFGVPFILNDLDLVRNRLDLMSAPVSKVVVEGVKAVDEEDLDHIAVLLRRRKDDNDESDYDSDSA